MGARPFCFGGVDRIVTRASRQEGAHPEIGMVQEGWRCAVVYSSANWANANAIEKALHERYKHCLGPGGLKIALAQRDGAGGTGGTLCDKYFVRMPF